MHRYILACRSEYFRQLFTANTEQKEDEDDDLHAPHVHIDNADPEIFMQLLTFIYTDTCAYLTIGAKVDVERTSCSSSRNKEEELDSGVELIPRGTNISAYAHNKKKKKDTKGPKKEGKKEGVPSENPLKKLHEMAKRFGVKQLAKRLDNVKLRDGYIQLVSGRTVPKPQPKFDCSKHVKLCDVNIRSSVDDSVVAAHKCILVARLEYFHSMLASGWIEVGTPFKILFFCKQWCKSLVIDDSFVIGVFWWPGWSSYTVCCPVCRLVKPKGISFQTIQ